MAVGTLAALRQNSHTPATVFVPGGRFSLGSTTRSATVREVEVRPLRFGRTPVTNMEYAWFLAAGRAPEPPWWKDPDFWDPDQPVVGATWFEACAYCAWLGETVGGRWRLPTEAEWEHAARGGIEQGTTPWGEIVPKGELREPPLAGPWAAGRGTPNGFGLLDPGTLVQEWCHDWYAADAYEGRRRFDPRGPETGERRVRRGGSWRIDLRHSPSWSRVGAAPLSRAADGGFRVVREVP
jgi:formylglycine-generating enzyme required for sulfatase activity